jgi:hypothetical protein
MVASTSPRPFKSLQHIIQFNAFISQYRFNKTHKNASFRNMHSLDFINHPMLKIKIKAKFSGKWQITVHRRKSTGHIIVLGPTKLFSTYRPQCLAYWPIPETTTHNSVAFKCKGNLICSFCWQMNFSAKLTGLTRIKCLILFQLPYFKSICSRDQHLTTEFPYHILERQHLMSRGSFWL